MRKRELVTMLAEQGKTIESVNDNYTHAMESLAQLELAQEDIGWLKTAFTGQEFSKDFITQIYDQAVTSYISNPLTHHGVNVQGNYVFGQGVTIKGESDDVDKLWQLFWNHPANRIAFTTMTALFLKEVDLQMEGNLFLALFTTPSTGAVKVRSIITSEIVDIFTNPDDAKEPWYYLRRWQERKMSDQGMWSPGSERKAVYPAWNYRPNNMTSMFGDVPIMWNAPVYHQKVGGTSHMRFGVTEFYSALAWAQAMREALEDYATVRSSHARWAWQLSNIKGGKKGVEAAKAKIGTTYGDSATAEETNPSPVAGAVALSADGMARLETLKTAGGQAPPDEARMLAVMTGAGHGQPYSILTGDADKSNLATAKSLDRPTELMMNMRRMLWTTIFTDICSYLVYASVRAPNGVVKGKIVEDDWGTPTVDLGKDEEGEPVKTSIVVTWPPILEHDVSETVKAIVSAATLDGKTDAGIFDLETIIGQLGNALGVENVGDIIDKMVAEAEAAPPAEGVAEEAAFVGVLKEVQAVLRKEQE